MTQTASAKAGGRARGRSAAATGERARKRSERTPRESLKTIAFDSKGHRKYALQIQKARNGNPCLRLVEGTPQPDGSFRKFDLTIWSEDWPALFDALDEMRAFIRDKGIRTPEGHNWQPRAAH